MKQTLLFLMMLPIMANADDSGSCGENLTWKYVEDTKTLTISGTGAMTNYKTSYYGLDSYWVSTSPWDNRSIQKLIIESGVTTIGSGAFASCYGLTSVIIPNTVTSIGENAFLACHNLASITIPCSVTNLRSAFSNCSIKETIIVVPDLSAFCNNSAVHWLWGNIKLIDKEGNEIKDCVIPTDITTIDDNTFANCSGLTSLTISNNVLSIGNNAFDGCNGLTSIIIGSGVKSIGNDAFSSCESLKTIMVNCIPTSLGKSLFSDCPNIKEVSFDCEIVKPLFSGLSTIEKVSFTDNVTSIGQYAFKNCSGIKSMTIPKSVKSIGNEAFFNCSGLASVIIPRATSIGSNAFQGCTSLTSMAIPNSVTSIGASAFSGCTGLTSIIIPNSVTSIGSCAFQNCSNLTSLIIGSGVTSIGDDAFRTTNLKKTIWLTNTPPLGCNNAAGTLNYVSNDQFSFNNQVKYQFLGSYFDVDGIRYVPISPSERTCDAIDCVYDESAKDTKIASTVSYKGVTMNVKSINPYLAYGNNYIETLSVDIEGMMANYAFSNCINLKSVIYSDKITGLGDHVFSGCSSLISVKTTDNIPQDNVLYISKNINSIEDYALYGCSGIKNVIIADSDIELKLGSNSTSSYYSSTGAPLFADCPLDYVYIGRNIDYKTGAGYGYSPFYRNTTLREIKITDKETVISDNEFYGCTNLQSVTIGDGVTTIGKWAFSGCSSLSFFAFGSQVANIGQEAFSDCSAVIEIISKAKTAPICGSQALDDINKWDCKLYVPDGGMATYEAADQWKDFFFKEEGEGTSGQGSDNQDKGKCETPTISIVGDKLSFESQTNGVIFHYSISHSDVKTDISNGEVTLTNTYEISVYASKEGYKDSDVATKEIQVKNGKLGDLNGDGKVDVADHVVLSDIIMGE